MNDVIKINRKNPYYLLIDEMQSLQNTLENLNEDTVTIDKKILIDLLEASINDYYDGREEY